MDVFRFLEREMLGRVEQLSHRWRAMVCSKILGERTLETLLSFSGGGIQPRRVDNLGKPRFRRTGLEENVWCLREPSLLPLLLAQMAKIITSRYETDASLMAGLLEHC